MATKAQPGSTTATQTNNPLHGITLETVLHELVGRHGWDGLGRRIDIRCFHNEPSIASSLKFLRRTPWARQKVEALYLAGVKQDQRKPAARTTKDNPA